MDRISNELLQEILNYAMLSKIPFCMDDFVNASKCARPNKKPNDQSSNDVLVSDLRITSPDDGEPTGKRPSALTINGTNRRDFDSHLDPSQLPNLQDWRLIVGTSRRFRELGKVAFFSHKTFVMEPETVDLLRRSQLKPLSVEDQQVAVQYTTSIIFLERSSQSPSLFPSLPRRIAPFPHLLHIGFLFGYRKKEPLELLIRAVQEGRPAPDHFTSALASIGMPVDKLQIAVMACPTEAWGMHVANLQRFIYPMIKIAAKAREERSKQRST